MKPPGLATWLLGALALTTAAAAPATQVKIFQTQSAVGFLGGKLNGISVDALGRLRLADSLQRVTASGAIAEPFVFAAAALPAGRWVVGTGNSGKVLSIDEDGKVRELFTAPESEVFAVWADPDGTVFAGTSPHGKVYRIANGKGAVFFDPGETYIWALARDAGGKLLVATGTQGKLYRVDASGHGEVALATGDTHVRALAPLPDGEVVLGTAGKGLILRLGRDGKARALLQGEEPEVAALAAAPDGAIYAALVSSEASLVDLGRESAEAGAPGAGAAGSPGAGAPAGGPARKPARAVPEEGGEPPVIGSRRPGAGGPRSELVRIAADGRAESLWTFPSDTVFSLVWQSDRLWIATGVEGKLYSWAGGEMRLAEELDDRQLVALVPGQPYPAFATTNGAGFYRIANAAERQGTYLSAVLDAGQVARFGTFRWRGELPEGSGLRFSFRSGITAFPDDTWSPWISPRPGAEAAAASPAELPLGSLPRGRFVQWRAELTADRRQQRSPMVFATELSYRQDNLPPRIAAFGALDPGQILVPATFNPSNQVYEPAHPNKDGIFVPVGAPALEEGPGRTKPLWKKGFRTLRWNATDPNDDPLVFDLYFLPAGAVDSGHWLKLAGDVEDDHYSFDATVLPDGAYRFRLVASDRNANDPDAAQSTERISEPVVIDHTPPVLVGVERQGKQLRVTLRDAASPIREAVYSLDAGAWKPAPAADGLLDALTETVLVEIDPAKSGLVLLRATDAAYNVVTFDLTPWAASR
ncbi:MAG TPA: hypothetical protein VKY89_00475 [Thermoanaerobaculia bacterium]|nr:hypothetical protein [Thermoanaerobaculia bacterium]